MRSPVAVATLLLAAGCAIQSRPAAVPQPIEDGGEVYVYLRPRSGEATRLSFTVTSAAATSADGVDRPLALLATAVVAGEGRTSLLVATGRLPSGDYRGISLGFTKASATRSGKKVDLRLPVAPVPVPGSFTVVRKQAVVLELDLDGEASVTRDLDFDPRFRAAVPARTSWQLAGFVSNPGATSLTVFDKRARTVTGVVPTGRDPRGMALDPRGNRLYVALSGDDAVDIVDVAAGRTVSRVTMNGNDRPRDVALLADGKLLVLNSGSRSASFVDAASTQEIARVPVGEEPWSLTLDRSRPRAYVLNRRSNTLTAIDTAARAVVANVPTDPEPLWAQVNAAGTRLYLACAGSAFLGVYSLPDLALVRQVHVGLGSSALKVDNRTDQIYLGKRDEGRVYVYEPSQFLAIDDFEVPDPASFMAIDDVDNTLFVLVPERRQVVVFDLTSRNVVGSFEVGASPYQVTVSGARN